jgi:hypothetical protein
MRRLSHVAGLHQKTAQPSPKREVKRRREHNKEKLNPKTREKGRGGKKRTDTGRYLGSDNIENEQGSGWHLT